ncbi:MAG: hypothetical protein E7613_05775 [Ruminococcaceae bacterium]|nr:hypothetical protein [Oscillospiraceae bacterium]
MNKHYFKQTIVPCVLLSALAGVFTGVLIFIFKSVSKLIIEKSFEIYAFVRENVDYLPLLFVGALLVGLVSYAVVHYIPGCRGGGIPTAVAILRGHLPFKWLRTILGTFASSIVTFAMGVPLGNEGPSVQMGCAVGRGTVNAIGSKNKAWDRYVMTGSASGGFAAATFAPLSGILFAFEEVHRKFSPILFMSVVSSVAASFTITEFLCEVFGTETALFHISLKEVLPLKYILIVIVVGAVAGAFAIFFARLYRVTDRIMRGVLAKVPRYIKIVSIFFITSVLGFFSPDFIGSGHDVICEIMCSTAPVWYLLLIYLIVRLLLLLFANTAGITGGIFIPSLTFGAMLGSLMAKVMISLDFLPEKYAPVLVVVAMTAFLAASSKIPMTAIAFSAEAMTGAGNIMPIILGTAVAYIIVEIAGAESLTDSVIESKIHTRTEGKEHFVIDAHFTVSSDSFAVGKELRDILLPPNCVIVSMEKKELYATLLNDGDILHLRYKTYDHQETYAYLVAIFGKQPQSKIQSVHSGDDNYALPEI